MNYELRITNLSAIVLLLLLGGILPVSGQEWVRQLFPVKEHDFGTVPRGAKAAYRFEITNPFEEEIHLGKATASCICATPVVETPVLKSHETGGVLVHFNTDRVSGNEKATITVPISKPFPAVATLQIRGYVRSDITFEPASAQFGPVPVGEERVKTVKVIYHGKNAFWNVRQAESFHPNISVEIGKTTPKRGRTEVEITLKLDKDAPVGSLGGNLFLTTSDATSGRIPLQVEGEVQPPIVVRPTEYSFGTVYEGDENNKIIFLTGDKPFCVKGFATSNGVSDESSSENFLTITPEKPLESESRKLHTFKLTLIGPKVDEPKSIRETVVFETDNPDVTPTLTILAVVKPKQQPVDP